MTTDVAAAWDGFRDTLEMYGDAVTLLNPPCSVAELAIFEQRFNLALPPALTALLALNNGQRIDERGAEAGLFKSLSGWNVYERHVFLSIQEIAIAYQTFISDEVLVAEFGRNEIPFAVATGRKTYSPKNYKEAFCINSLTGAVSLIWTQYFDPLNPPEWQVQKFKRAESLSEFIEKQTGQYN